MAAPAATIEQHPVAQAPGGRSLSPDVLKAAATVGVVCIHGGFLLGGRSDVLETLTTSSRFCVPVFIGLWAYFAEMSLMSKPLNTRGFIQAKLGPIVLPYLFWSLLYLFLQLDVTTLSPARLLSHHMLGYGWSGQYFFLILFQLPFVFLPLRWIYTRPVLAAACLGCCVALYTWSGWFYDAFPTSLKLLAVRPFVYWVPYVLLGILLARHRTLRLPLIAAVAVLLMPIEAHYLLEAGKRFQSYLTPAVLLGSVALLAAVTNRTWSWRKGAGGGARLIQYVGANTFPIFVLNPLVIYFGKDWLAPVRVSDPTMPVIMAVARVLLSNCLIIAACLLIAAIIRRMGMSRIL